MNLNNCIICSSEDNLNTSMSFTIDDNEYQIFLCDEHAEDTTPKQAKQSLKGRITEIEEFMEKAKALGIQIGDINPTADIQIKRPSTGISQMQPQATEEKAEGIPLPGSFKGVSGNVEGLSIAGHSSIRIDEEVKRAISNMKANDGNIEEVIVPEDIVTEVQEVRDAGGGVAIIPKKLRGNTGSMNVSIKSTGGDAALQRRFKQMAEESMEKDGYKTQYKDMDVPCTFCGGSGISKIGKQECPKCSGSGIIAT